MATQHTTATRAAGKKRSFMGRLFPWTVFLIPFGLIAILVWMIMEKSTTITAEKEASINLENPPANVVTLQLTPSTIRDRINLPGQIEPWTTLQVLAKTEGVIDTLLVKEGDRVKKGDVIAILDDEDYLIALDRAQIAYRQAKADFDRDRVIYTEGMIPEAEYELRLTTMESAKTDLDQARLDYSRCQIKAPLDGLIRQLDAKVGLLLSVADPVATIIDIDKVKAVIGIPESDVDAIRNLDTVELTINALDNLAVKAKKYFLAPTPKPTARLYDLELAIDNRHGRILPGMFIRADIVKEEAVDSIVVPFFSVIMRDGDQYVFVSKNGRAEKRQIRTGIIEDHMLEIESGLAHGESLIVEGHRRMREDQEVRVVRTIINPEEISL